MKEAKFIIGQIQQKDNEALAKLIRTTLEEFNVPTCGTVYSDPTTDNLYQLFQTPGSIFYVAYLNDKVAGCCGIFPTEGLPTYCAELVKFYVDKDARGLGIGRELMQLSITYAKQAGYKQLYLESFPAFTTAIAMYEKNGFRPLKQPLGNSGHTSCNVWMLMNIS